MPGLKVLEKVTATGMRPRANVALNHKILLGITGADDQIKTHDDSETSKTYIEVIV